VALLVERYQFDPSLISAAGYSEYRPVGDNKTQQGRADNRRIDLVVVGRVPEKDKLAQDGAAPAGPE
jgi:flagellar motor protein MotB